MTESEWLSSTDPQKMLEWLQGRASHRKLRLFACACCRRVWDRTDEAKAPQEVEISELYADKLVSRKQVRAARKMLGARGGYSSAWAANTAQFAVLEERADHAATRAITAALAFAFELSYEQTFSEVTYLGDRDQAMAAQVNERTELAEVVREVFGNSLRQKTVTPDWLTPNVINLATATYEERNLPSGTLDPARLAVLSDALEEAGCNDDDILNHCRQPGVHVRGCWVVDLLMSKE